MSWAAGLMSILGLIIIVALAAQIVDEDRKELKHVRKLEAARRTWKEMNE